MTPWDIKEWIKPRVAKNKCVGGRSHVLDEVPKLGKREDSEKGDERGNDRKPMLSFWNRQRHGFDWPFEFILESLSIILLLLLMASVIPCVVHITAGAKLPVVPNHTP